MAIFFVAALQGHNPEPLGDRHGADETHERPGGQLLSATVEGGGTLSPSFPFATAINAHEQRAAELRTIADNTRNASSRDIIVTIGEDYERMARSIDLIEVSKRKSRL